MEKTNQQSEYASDLDVKKAVLDSCSIEDLVIELKEKAVESERAFIFLYLDDDEIISHGNITPIELLRILEKTMHKFLANAKEHGYAD